MRALFFVELEVMTQEQCGGAKTSASRFFGARSDDTGAVGWSTDECVLLHVKKEL